MVYVDKLRQNAIKVVSDARNRYISPYEEWTSDQLRELLAYFKIPIRDSANTSHETLVRICEKVFGDAAAETAKESRRHYSIEDLIRMDAAARVIQNAFLRRQALKRQESRQYHEYHADQSRGKDVGGYSRLRRLSMERRIFEQDDDCDDDTIIEWQKPSIEYAKKVEFANRPHRPGKQMVRYDWTRITLGRHCWASECGEQFDLWNEGRTSEFSQFGSGITNYFKVRPMLE
ncbi:hypothetical protein ACHAXA_002540 [Cyclostephanos tholiformis]|uniref:Uncharacterized protein n=1 Tax=Cyclostephanos tholiformis TaxID=382380 RepID=A0ABD3RG01_9STRA